MKKILFLIIVLTFNTQIILSQRIDPYLDLIYKSKTAPIKSKKLTPGSKEFEFRDKLYKNRKSLNPFFKKMNIDTLENDPLINVLMQYHGSINKLIKQGAIIDHRQGEFVMAKIPTSAIRAIGNIVGVVQMELSKPIKYEMDVSRNAIGVNSAHNTFPYRGNGIVVGIIDTGIDYDNDAFKTTDLSTSRIQYIWDQTIDGDPPSTPSNLNFGTEWNNAEINAGGLAHLDNVGHGTRVAGIIAGNGKTSLLQTDYIGIAPEADLVVVKILVEEKDPIWFPENSFYENVIDGIRYIKEKAKELNKPWVINLSIGANHGPRNGTSSFEKWMGEYINNSEYRNDGRIIVKSAGNNGYDPAMPNPNQTRKIHAGRTGPMSVDFEITDIQPTGNMFAVEIYFPQEDVFSVTIQSPNGYVVGPVEKSDDPRFSNADGGPTLDGWISVSNGGRNANVSRYAERVDDIAIITIADNQEHTGIPGPPADGTWTITMSEGTGEWDAYVYGYNDDTKIYFTDASYTNDNVISEPGNAASILTVGSVNTKNNWVSTSGITNRPEYIIGSISDFSSPGPTRAGIQKPEIYAPGAWISSVYAHEMVNPLQSNYAWTAEYYHGAGTSYAAAHITGTVVLLLEKWNVERDMDYGMPYIKQVLRNTNVSGGVVDVFQALAYDEPVTGLEDHVNIDNYYCSSANPATIEPGINSQFCARFIDDEPYGDYAVSYSWKIVATNSTEGEVVLGSYNSGQANYSSWNLNLSSSLIEDENWVRDINDNIQATIQVTCYDDDGYSHKDDLHVGIKCVPNKPLIDSHTITGTSITLSYIAGGANTYRIHYGTSSGSPYHGTGATQGNSPINTGSLTEYTISGLDFDNNTYFFAVTALNNEGESEYSDEVVIGDIEIYDIVWTDIDGVKTNGNSLTKSRVRNNWYEGAASFNELPPNTDGWIEMTAVENNTYRMFGLSDYNAAATWNTIDHSFYVKSNGSIQIYESGSSKCSCGSYSVGDKVRVERIGSQILYKLNGNTIYTSNCDPSKSLIADVSLYSTTSTISNAVASFPALSTSPHNIEWTDLVKVYANYNSLTRDDSYRGWNAGAASINRLINWTDGWIETTIQETNSYRMFGLSSSNSDPYWNTIDYNLYLRKDSKIMIYESGSYKGTFGYYNYGDKVRLERIDNQILYKLNGATLYTSTCDPSENLYSDVSMYSPSSTLFDVKSSFRNYDQYVAQQQSMMAMAYQEIVFVDDEVINTDSLSTQQKVVNNASVASPKIIYNEAILKDSTSYNPLSEIIISPNPTTGKINLNYTSEVSNNIQIDILDYLNVMCFEKVWKIKEGENNILLNLNPYKSKLFIVRVRDKYHTYNYKVLKE